MSRRIASDAGPEGHGVVQALNEKASGFLGSSDLKAVDWVGSDFKARLGQGVIV